MIIDLSPANVTKMFLLFFLSIACVAACAADSTRVTRKTVGVSATGNDYYLLGTGTIYANKQNGFPWIRLNMGTGDSNLGATFRSYSSGLTMCPSGYQAIVDYALESTNYMDSNNMKAVHAQLCFAKSANPVDTHYLACGYSLASVSSGATRRADVHYEIHCQRTTCNSIDTVNCPPLITPPVLSKTCPLNAVGCND